MNDSLKVSILLLTSSYTGLPCALYGSQRAWGTATSSCMHDVCVCVHVEGGDYECLKCIHSN